MSLNLRSIIPAVAILCAAIAAHADTVTSGMILSGSLQTGWSSDLGRDYSQSLHPTVATPGDGATTPVTPDGYQFTGETVIVSLTGKGLSGTMTIYTPPTGVIDGQLYHLNVVLSTPVIDYYGMAIASLVDGSLYVAGGSTNQLYYRLRLGETTTGGGGSGNTHSLNLNFNNTYLLQNSEAANFSDEISGSTTVHTWRNGSVVNSPDGNGFVSLSFDLNAGHGSGGTGPGETTAYDLWLTLSSAPVTGMPIVPTQVAVTSSTGEAINLSFPTQPWLTYVLEQATNLTPPVLWQAITPNHAGTGKTLTLTNTIGTNAMGFFRIRSQ
jgi:hypothetical protein